MKTLLIYPRFWEFSSPPLGIVYIAANMRKHGMDVKVVDCTFNMTLDKLTAIISDYRPDVIGISLMTDMLKIVRQLLVRIREVSPDAVIVTGGPHPSVLPVETLKNYDIDIVAVGEGEELMVELVNALENGSNLENIPGIYYKHDGRISGNTQRGPIADLDLLPFPQRDMLAMSNYLKMNVGRSSWTVPRPSTTVIASRGCPFNCTFCSTHLIHGKKVRYRSPQNFIDEVELLVKEYKLKGIWFNDDTFTMNKTWVKDIFQEMDRRGLKFGWGCNTRVDSVNEEILMLMKEHGCTFISFGVESGVQNILDNYLKKDERLQQIKDTFALAAKAGIFTQATFMVGIPGESLQDMYSSMKFAMELNPDCIQVSMATPFPKTELVEIAAREGCLKDINWEDLDYMTDTIVHTDKFSPEQVKKIQKEFLKKFYFRFNYIFYQLRRIRSISGLLKRLRGFYQLIWGNVSPLSFIKNFRNNI